ncbi:MAG: ABC transporter ATP-binding protein [Candidatus Hydrogenedentes bacterium]|nr:ABC transporter ATP-binding protein [Candidatus Hydrogenedentota bacterium]
MAVYVIRIPITYFRTYFAELAGNRTIFDVREELYQHVLRLSLDYHAKQRTGATTSRLINDVNTAQGILDRGVMSILVDIIFLTGVVLYLVAFDWRLAAASLFTLPLYAAAFGVLNPKLRVVSREVQAEMGQMSGEVNEKLTGLPVVLAFVGERFERLRFFRQHRKYFDTVMHRVRLNAVLVTVGEFLNMLGPMIVICYGGYRVIQGHLSEGNLVIFYGFLSHLYLPTRRLADASAAVQMQLAGMDRVFEMLDVAPQIQDAPTAHRLDACRGLIEFEDVHFSYLPRQPVLEGITLRVRPGQAVAIVGPSGGGKSTLIKLVPRFYDATRGAVRIDGHDVRALTQQSLRSHIGMVMQDPILFNGTVRENILYGRRNATEEEMLEAARMAHVDEFISYLPEGFDTIIGERGVTLSGGQKQRVSIARAFLRDPRILILDEATSNLDSHAESIIQDALARLMEGRTTLVIAHRLSTIIGCDHVVVIDQGQIVQEGTHDELVNAPGLYRMLCEDQFGVVQLEDITG